MEHSKNIRVVVRVRPLNRRELEQNQQAIIRVIDTRNLIFDPEIDEDEFFFHGAKQTHRDITKRVNKKLNMEFDDVFDEESRNMDVFEACMKPLVTSVMGGYNCSVFVYGATGAGKTHTMLGNEENPGITFLTMQELFSQIDELAEERKFDIGISYLEVYNEQVMNLLTKTGPMMLREDANGVVVKGLCLKPIYNAEELLNLLAVGNRNRTQHPTDANAESSRSHAIFQVHIRMIDRKTSQKRTVKLSMIDLAGSERAASTKCMGMRFKEGASINKSLLALGNCINKLADGLKHIPYRDSNLTRILKDSLGGNCQTVMIANVSQSSLTYEDTYNTLKYASRAKKIRTTLKQNILQSNLPKEFFIKKLSDQQIENDRLKLFIQQLEAKLAQNDGITKSNNIAEGPEFDLWCAKIDSVYATALKAQENYFTMQSKEKVLKLRSKLKEHAESSKMILQLDGSHLCADIAKLEASIDKYGKQVARQRDDMIRWEKRYSDAVKNLKILHKEIEESDMKSILLIYTKAKEMELTSAKTNISALHLIKVNSIYLGQTEHWRKTIDLSCDIIQQNYLLLRASGRIDIVIREKLNSLVKMIQGQRNVKFDDETHFNETDLGSLSFHQTALLLNEDIGGGDEIKSSTKKRPKPPSFDDDEIRSDKTKFKTKLFKEDTHLAKTQTFKNPNNINLIETTKSNMNFNINRKVLIKPIPKYEETESTVNLNETQTLSTDDQLAEELPDITPFRFNKNTINRPVLMERNNTMRRAQTLKSSCKTISMNRNTEISKENKKFSPNKIRKVARPISREAIATKANLLKQHIRTKSASTSSSCSDTETSKRIRLVNGIKKK